jgi:hypothetical protein
MINDEANKYNRRPPVWDPDTQHTIDTEVVHHLHGDGGKTSSNATSYRETPHPRGLASQRGAGTVRYKSADVKSLKG